MKVDLTHIKIIHDLARTGSTGRPEDLANRLEISVRSLSDLIRYMREDLDIPIQYDRMKQTYCCLEEGYLSFKFQRDRELAKRLIKLIQTSLVLVIVNDAHSFLQLF